MKIHIISLGLLSLMLLALTACSSQAADDSAREQQEAAPPTAAAVFENTDFKNSPFKHINNGGITDSPVMPYNIDAITGATVTIEGAGIASSVPMSMRELQNENDGLVRAVFEDSNGFFAYEGIDLYYLLYKMTRGDKGISLTGNAHSVRLKDRNRELVAEITLADIKAAHENGRPVLLAYGIGTPGLELAAPFVYDGAHPGTHSEGYIPELGNDGGCLKLVYDFNTGSFTQSGGHPAAFPGIAYIYVAEESEPGFKHTASENPAYSSPRLTDYIIAFRGQALGAEINLTVAQLESMAHYESDGSISEGSLGFRDFYSLANNAYWYVNEYEGIDLYKLLLYLGMEDAEAMGRAAARTTLVSFIADDGFSAPESFSVETLSLPEVFGFFKKNAIDMDDGTYIPTAADLERTGYPVLLAYGVNGYPYTISKYDDGYLSGLSNDGGPMRVVFGKTQYNHANGSHQIKFLRDVIAGNDVLCNTHKYTDNELHNAYAGDELHITIKNEDGSLLTHTVMSVGDIEDLIYGEDVSNFAKREASGKNHYEYTDGSGISVSIFEGVNLSYFLTETLGISGADTDVTFYSGDGSSLSADLARLTQKGCTPSGSDSSAVIAFAKNGSPLVPAADSPGYVKSIPLRPFSGYESDTYIVENSGGPLAVLIPGRGTETGGALSLMQVSGIEVTLIPDADEEPPGSGSSSLPAAGVSVNASDTWWHGMSAVYSEFLDYEFTLTIRNDDSEWVNVFTVAELEGMTDIIVRDTYSVLDFGQCEGIDIWKLIRRYAGNVPGIDTPVSVTVFAGDGYFNDLLSVFGQSALEHGVPDGEGGRKPLIIAYAMNGLPLVDSENHAGYTGFARNSSGPLRAVAETKQGSCVKHVAAMTVVIPGSGDINPYITKDT